MRTTERPLAENEIMVRIMNVMERKGIRQKDLMERIGVASPVFSRWKYDNGKSFLNHIESIAQCLNVTPEYLLNGTETIEEPEYSLDDIEIAKMIRQLSPEQKKIIRLVIEEFLKK